jgi:hypothetical protein
VQTQQSFQARFPAYRAFVVHIAVADVGGPDGLLGRVEHVRSGQAAQFASWAECVAFIERVLAAGEAEPPATP